MELLVAIGVLALIFSFLKKYPFGKIVLVTAAGIVFVAYMFMENGLNDVGWFAFIIVSILLLYIFYRILDAFT